MRNIGKYVFIFLLVLLLMSSCSKDKEVIRLEIDRKPDVRQAMRQLLGQQLIESLVNKPVLSQAIPEEELRQYYDDHQELYSRAEQIRLADIFIAASSECGQAGFTEKKKKANNILNQAQSMSNERFGFGRLIREYSDQHSRYRLGDTGFLIEMVCRVGLPRNLWMQVFPY